MTPWLQAETVSVFVAGIATLAIFSYVINENPLYRVFEHLFIGVAAGLGVIVSIKTFLWPSILEPMLGLDIVQFPDGTYSKEYDSRWCLYLIPMLIGLLYYFIYSKRFGWLAKIAIGVSLGASGGIAFQAFFNEITPQVVDSFKPLVVVDTADGVSTVNYFASAENIFFLFTLISVMYYFFFTHTRKNAVTDRLSSSGRWLMMVCFGAFFGSTVMARMALLVERLQFLIADWSAVVSLLLGGRP